MSTVTHTMHTRTHTRTHIHTYTPCMHACTHTHTHMHAHTHTHHTHTHTHTHTHARTDLAFCTVIPQILMRLIDDFLLVTPDRKLVASFLLTLTAGETA